jgi:hypothetical protein
MWAFIILGGFVIIGSLVTVLLLRGSDDLD